jgi:MarR family 2-MHQ and catechol resistance regulon transcriptional repressor
MGTRYKGSEQEVRALNAFITLMRAADAVSDYSHRHLSEHELTISQFGALEALYHCGALCQGELAGKLMRSLGSVTSLLDVLERRGLVERKRAGEDRRFVTASLTKKGRGLIDKILPAHVRTITRRFAALSPKQQEELRALCRQLGKGGAS